MTLVARHAAIAAALAVVVLAVAACGSATTPSGDPALAKPVLAPTTQRAGQVAMTLSADVQSYIAANPRFDHWTLLAKIRESLRTEDLLTATSDAATPTVSIVITDAYIRPSGAAVMLGIMAGDDRLAAEVTVLAPNGAVLQRFLVTASYTLGGVYGAHRTRTGWLYDAFARRVVEGLRGSPSS
jgi:hypothetical protein